MGVVTPVLHTWSDTAATPLLSCPLSRSVRMCDISLPSPIPPLTPLLFTSILVLS